MKSLRNQLVFFWTLLFTMCAALAVVMVVLYNSSAGAQIAQAETAARQSCSAIAARYARSLPDTPQGTPQLDLLQVILQLVLTEAPHVEGGVWSASGGLIAYAYPTYEGSGVKRDIPAAEQPLIIETAQLAARTRRPQTDVVRGLVAYAIADAWSNLPVQILDGLAAGALGVTTPLLVQRYTQGSGRFNTALGLVMTMQGVGAALSPTLANGVVGDQGHFGLAFLVLAGASVLALAVSGWRSGLRLQPTAGLTRGVMPALRSRPHVECACHTRRLASLPADCSSTISNAR